MANLFESALAILADESQVVTNKTLTLVSGPSRSETASFTSTWAGLSVERRRDIISRLVELGEGRFDLDYAALYRVCLADPDGQVRASAIEGLWEDESWDLVHALIRALEADPDQAVRAAAAVSLGRYVFMAECDELEPQRAARIRTALEHTIANTGEAPEVIRRAVEAIAYINDDQVSKIIERAYEQRNEEMKASAIFGMGRNAEPRWTDIILHELDNASPVIRYEAARASGEMQLPQAVARLIKLVRDTDAEVQQMAIWALGQIGGKQAETTLQQLAQSESEAISDAAQDALEALEFDTHPLGMIEHAADTEQNMVEVDLSASTLDDEDNEIEAEDNEDGEDDGLDDWDDEPLELE